MPKPSSHWFNWKVDLGDILTIISVLVTIILAYADLRSDIKNNEIKALAKFELYDKMLETQKKVDVDQNERMLRMYQEIQSQIKDVKTDIRSDIKDLKTDMAIRAGSSNNNPGRTVR